MGIYITLLWSIAALIFFGIARGLYYDAALTDDEFKEID